MTATPLRSESGAAPFLSTPTRTGLRAATGAAPFRSATAAARKVQIRDLMAFRRRQGDLLFSILTMAAALFLLASFWGQTGWTDRDLPDDLGAYFGRQLGLVDGEGRLDRFGKILKQGWVGPLMALTVLVPAAAVNLRRSWIVHRWRVRFLQPTGLRHELVQWARALEFVGWFVAYTLLVPVLGYLIATLLLGTVLPWRLGYRGARWTCICLAVSLAIVLLFRTGLQIRTPVNIWLYSFLPRGWESFMQTWF